MAFETSAQSPPVENAGGVSATLCNCAPPRYCRHIWSNPCNKGKSLCSLKRHQEALAAYERAVALKPDLAEAWLGRGYFRRA
ncbi:MAG: tetratricopeptide repeat protein [Pseudolabrys sp.]